MVWRSVGCVYQKHEFQINLLQTFYLSHPHLKKNNKKPHNFKPWIWLNIYIKASQRQHWGQVKTKICAHQLFNRLLTRWLDKPVPSLLQKNAKACLYNLPVQLMEHRPSACLLYLPYNKVFFVPNVSITEFGVYSGVTVITVEL